MKKEAAVKRKSGSSNLKVKFPGMSKNGWELPVFVISIVVVALAAIMVSKAPIYGLSGNVISGGAITGYAAAAASGASVQGTTWGSIFGVVKQSGALVNAFQYIFGQPVSYSGASAFSGAIITLALWLILFLTFADIISTFSTFSPWVSWIVGFLIAVVAANVGFVTGIAVWAVSIFSVLGTIAVWAGLVASLVAFVAVNLGLSFLGKWVMRRRAMMYAATTEAGGEEMKGILSAFKTAGEGFHEAGSENKNKK